MSKRQDTPGVERRRFHPYPQYKDSGVEWLGKIPTHWKARHLKYLSRIIMGQSPPSDIVNTLGEGRPFLQGNADFGAEHPTARTFCPYPPKVAAPEDILISVRAPVGAINSADREYGIGRGLCAIRPFIRQLGRRYCSYLLQVARSQLDSIAKGSTYDAVSADDVSCLMLSVPSIEEQHRISHFLDRETAKIDALIEKKERLIKLLQEKRTALITQAVTKGIDLTVSMKDSGVEWIERIPGSWRVCPLFAAAREKEKRNYGNQVQNVLSLSYGKIIDKDVSDNFGLLPESFETYQIVSKGNIILRLTDLQNDKRSLRVGLVRHQGIITSAYICLDFFRDIDPSYAFYLLHAYDITKVFYGLGGGVRQTMKFEDLKWLPILMPSAAEQQVIASFLDREATKIDALISRIREAITSLKEYRTALIFAAVTGKMDVREVQ